MFWNKKAAKVTLSDGVQYTPIEAIQQMSEQIIDLELQLEDLIKDNNQLTDEVEELTEQDKRFKAGLVELLEPRIVTSISDVGLSPEIDDAGGIHCALPPWKEPVDNNTEQEVDGAGCACSPIGEDHSDNCKGATW